MNEHKIKYFLDVAKTISKQSKCKRRKFGVVITSQDGVIKSTGYNGSVRGAKNCGENVCLKDLMNEPHYKSYNYCPAVHAEENSIINAAREGISIKNGILFLNSAQDGDCERPCQKCRRTIINAGIEDCYFVDKENKIVHEKVSSWIEMENEFMNDIKNKK
ncbi:MAG: hypothetical protein KJ767_02030 [Nanoarchaeota archaeon]|nr:hypothetical protein [Nanoarchaeota archaeon]